MGIIAGKRSRRRWARSSGPAALAVYESPEHFLDRGGGQCERVSIRKKVKRTVGGGKVRADVRRRRRDIQRQFVENSHRAGHMQRGCDNESGSPPVGGEDRCRIAAVLPSVATLILKH